MLNIENSCLVIVDVQGKLAQLMYDKERLFDNIQILIKSAKLLDLPVLCCQQCPQALGPTLPQIAELLEDCEPIDKSTFSCCGKERFNSKLSGLGRKQILLCGIETHVCIYQTAIDLNSNGFDVIVIADAVSSRTSENKHIALERLRAEGVSIACVEMALFELLKTAEHPQFRPLAKLIR